MSGGVLTVLVTDDDAGIRELYRHWLGDRHEVLTAEDGEQALERLDDAVDVVLLDRDMPGPSGSEVARRIATRDVTPHVVMVSSAPIDVDVETLPIHDYVRKPVDAADLEAVLAEYRARQEYETALADLFSITAAVATMEAEQTPAELAENERYERLQWLLDEKRVEVDMALHRRGDDWTKAFRSVAPPAPAQSPTRPV